MKAIPVCPRCKEVFERDSVFCKKCGLRKSRPYSRSLWWALAWLLNLCIVLLIIILRENVFLTKERALMDPPDIILLMSGALSLALLLLMLCFSRVWRILWLQRYGASTTGQVAGHRLLAAPKGRQRVVAVVSFRCNPDQHADTYPAPDQRPSDTTLFTQSSQPRNVHRIPVLEVCL